MTDAPQSVSDPYRRLSAGRLLGDKFEIVGVLGEGGTGVVYDAIRLKEKDSIALKVIHPHLLGDKQIRGRFAREAAILRRLTGPHLCAILDFGELSDPRDEGAGLLYIALPKIEGTPLDRLIKEQPSIERSLDVVLQVCEALKSAHAQGVIHRDLKPANVILRDGKHVMVVDFGMAKIVTGGGTGTTALTAHNMVFGTPEYMAPEQARGDELDARCDVYATGIILYEMLVGAVPFTGTSPLNVLTAQLTADPVPPRTRVPDRGITAAIEAVVMHALAKDPSERYATAGAFAAAIVHARARPEDPRSVRPMTFHIDGDALPDGHAATIPAPLPTDPVIRSNAPPSRVPTPIPVMADGKRGAGLRGWTVFWVLAALASIALGVWLSLRSN
jgi:eukaryotic-like serine/threonine-protein kinase